MGQEMVLKKALDRDTWASQLKPSLSDFFLESWRRPLRASGVIRHHRSI
jgi:hypothetical protein